MVSQCLHNFYTNFNFCRIEKDSSDVNKSSQEVAQKIVELQKKFEKAREQTRKAAGIEYNRAEQLHRLSALREQLSLKRQLLTKYQALQTLDGAAAPGAH
ncbi:Mediator of RNA polymerase II transcription subunit 9 [Amphibalanus amphitrite]|uniref:Mediator of RNA polymerase II transcription subunit 9 n=1 Tax=Amphibalanus amphitrite TaxID=1232801 RepID=A0A6A4V8V0_AMPAM|nr:Mediator of RNA polymerase II transcription subunit 9 [Amphibalanus amphitrite]